MANKKYSIVDFIGSMITYFTLYMVFQLTLLGSDVQDKPIWEVILLCLMSAISAYWICNKFDKIK